MTPQTITQLNQLNQDFYRQVAPDFDTSRRYPWEGWKKLVPLIQELLTDQSLRVLDLGAGNGRFAEFLSQTFPDHSFEYLAVDSNDYLLAQDWQKSLLHVERSQLKLDIVATLDSESLVSSITQHFWGTHIDLVVAFGLLHHLPSYKLRQKFIKTILNLADQKNSLAVVTAWQFLADEQQRQKIVSAAAVGIDPNSLEPNDYILSWNRGVTAYRYCHYLDETEVHQLQPADTHATFTTFFADGKSGQLNHYLVWRKNEE